MHLRVKHGSVDRFDTLVVTSAIVPSADRTGRNLSSCNGSNLPSIVEGDIITEGGCFFDKNQLPAMSVVAPPKLEGSLPDGGYDNSLQPGNVGEI